MKYLLESRKKHIYIVNSTILGKAWRMSEYLVLPTYDSLFSETAKSKYLPYMYTNVIDTDMVLVVGFYILYMTTVHSQIGLPTLHWVKKKYDLSIITINGSSILLLKVQGGELMARQLLLIPINYHFLERKTWETCIALTM